MNVHRNSGSLLKKSASGLLLAALLLLLPGFSWGAAQRDRGSPRAAQPAQAETVLFTDSSGRTVELPAKITRIAPSGSLAQMFLLAAAPDLLCAVSAPYSGGEAEFVPAYLQGLPVVGQFYGAQNLNPEELAVINPDVIIDIGEPKDSIAADMDQISASVAVPAIHITATLASTPDAFRTLGKLLGREAHGEALVVFCEKTLAAADAVEARAGNNKREVLYCLGNAGLNVLPKTSFHSEVLDKLTDNKAVVDNPAGRGSGNETNLEQILLWDPEVIIFGTGSIYASAGSDPAWRQLRAIRNGAYYEVPSGPHNWMGTPPSINRYLGMLWLGKILYPEYASYNLYAEVAEYYRLFYGYTLSRERYDRLTARSLHAGGPGRGDV
ncbi:MAG: ABC transporter substrate-binding protein [Spirochaetaceae bacterium]|jgi:iron complex transport system substrate-binding protein|nr:ABC transporter substrate-binding protein [Spirochaetaceae bacterium]